MIERMFFTQPFRRWIIRLYKYLPKQIQPHVLDKLYPDDLLINLSDKAGQL